MPTPGWGNYNFHHRNRRFSHRSSNVKHVDFPRSVVQQTASCLKVHVWQGQGWFSLLGPQTKATGAKTTTKSNQIERRQTKKKKKHHNFHVIFFRFDQTKWKNLSARHHTGDSTQAFGQWCETPSGQAPLQNGYTILKEKDVNFMSSMCYLELLGCPGILSQIKGMLKWHNKNLYTSCRLRATPTINAMWRGVHYLNRILISLAVDSANGEPPQWRPQLLQTCARTEHESEQFSPFRTERQG